MAQPNDETTRSVAQSAHASTTPDPQPSSIRRRRTSPSNEAASSVAQDSTQHPTSSNVTQPSSTTPASQPAQTTNSARTQTTPQRNNNNHNLFPQRAFVAVGIGLFSTTVGGTYLLADNEAIFPFAIAACILTFSSVVICFALSGIHPPTASHRVRTRHLRHHRHLTGERAAYVRTSQRLAMMDRDFTAADYELLLDLDNNSQRLRRFLEGASRETIDSLPTYTYKMKPTKAKEKEGNKNSNKDIAEEKKADKDDDIIKNVSEIETKNIPLPSQESELAGPTARTCTICLEDFEEGTLIRILPCFHHFMAECIDPWLQQQARCPICKVSLHEGMSTLPPGCT